MRNVVRPLISVQCISTVEQYVPVILSYVDAQLSADKLCNKTKICTSLEDFLTNDPSALTYDVRTVVLPGFLHSQSFLDVSD